MHILADTLDDLLHEVLEKLLEPHVKTTPTRGPNNELTGVLLELSDPRARLSKTEKKGTPFSCIGELLWYLAGSNELSFISYYISAYTPESEDGATVYGAYGPRLRNYGGKEIDQINNVLALLKRNSTSRRATIQLFSAEDLVGIHKEIPCTCTLQFLIRQDKLHMLTSMRSNDAYVGLPHDVFVFTMLQEILARTIDVEIGTYKHVVGSLHLYDRNIQDAQIYLDEGWQSKVSMPSMPLGDPWKAVNILIETEAKIRIEGSVDISKLVLDPYWMDLARLLLVFKKSKDKKRKEIQQIRSQMFSNAYEQYILKREL